MPFFAERSRRIRAVLRRMPGLAGLFRAGRAVVDPAYRKARRWHRAAGAQLFQPANVTWDNRYPQIFGFLAHVLAARPQLRIVSFGCATGEEVFTLADYFPAAEIIGIDINPDNIALCQQALAARPSPLIRFWQAADMGRVTPGSVDAVFCMAVLRHRDLAADKPERCDPVLRFADFARIVAGLESSLRDGGFLALWHSHFRVEDVELPHRFAPVMSLPAMTDDPLYGPDNRRMARTDFESAIFQKRTAS